MCTALCDPHNVAILGHKDSRISCEVPSSAIPPYHLYLCQSPLVEYNDCMDTLHMI